MESDACANDAAFRLWAAALGHEISSCEAATRESVLALMPAFAGRDDHPAWRLAALLLDVDLRPDDRLWVAGTPPDWFDRAWFGLACDLTAGAAASPDQATVWIGRHLPAQLPAGIRRAVVLEGPAPARPGLRVVSARDWDQARESSAD